VRLSRHSWTRNSSFKTLQHDLHKRRRNQLAPFFSKSSIRRLEPLIINKISKLCARLEAKSQVVSPSERVVNLTHAFTALTGDVISTVCFGQPTGFLDLDDLGRDWYEGRVIGSRSPHLLRQFPWLLFLPLSWIPGGRSRTAASLQYAQQKQKELQEKVAHLVEEHNAQNDGKKLRREGPDGAGEESLPETVFVSMLNADVPPSEKSVSRLTEEAFTLTGAGTMTTANALNSIVYYVLSRPECLQRLREELRAAFPDPSAIRSSADLEKLPYLTGVVTEGLRLSKGPPHRFARVSPLESYSYRRPWADGHVETTLIPRGVPVGMSFIDILEDKDIFPEPHAFKPERWLPTEPSSGLGATGTESGDGGDIVDDPAAWRRKWAVSTVFGKQAVYQFTVKQTLLPSIPRLSCSVVSPLL
jgi:cytochrome P450